MRNLIGSLSPDFAVEIVGKYGFLRDDYLGMLRLEHRQQGEEAEEERGSLQELVHHLQTQIENWKKQESTLVVTRPFVLSQLQKVLGHVSYMHEIRSKETLRQVDRHIERKAASVMRTVTTASGAGRQLSLHFYSGKHSVLEREVEKRLLEQGVPQEHIQQLLQTLHEGGSIHRIERHLHQHGVSSEHVEQIVQTLLHTQGFRETERVGVVRESTLLQEREMRFNHREVEKRLLDQELPQERIEQLLQTLHESRNIHQIERHLHQQGLSSHHVDQIVQTLLHPQVLQTQQPSTQRSQVHQYDQEKWVLPQERTLLQEGEVRFNHREVEKRLLDQELPQERIEQLLQTLHESRNIHQIERHLHQQGLSSHHVDQIVQTLLHPQVLQTQQPSTQRLLQTFMYSQGANTQAPIQQVEQTLLHSQVHHYDQEKWVLPLERMLVQEREITFNHREVEKRLFDQDIPQEHIKQLLLTLHESRNIHQIERHFQQQGLASHQVEQIVQTLLHPQVLQKQQTSTQQLLQTFLHPQVLPKQETSIQQLFQTLLHAQGVDTHVAAPIQSVERNLLSILAQPLERTLLQERDVYFNHREVEKRLLDKEIPQEHIQQLLQTLHESRNIHQIERHLHQQGVSSIHVDRILQTLLHPQVLQKRFAQIWSATSTTIQRNVNTLLHPQPQENAEARTQPRATALPVDYREVLKHGVPQLQQEFQRLHENSTFRLIEKQLQTLGVQSHHVQQVFQTLLHPQVLKVEGVQSQPIQLIVQTMLHPQVLMNLEESLFQHTALRFDHRDVDRQLSDQGLPSHLLQKVMQTLEHPQPEPALHFEHREVEKRLLEQQIPLEQIQQVLPALTQRSTFRQIEKYLTERGLPQQTIQQVMYTLLHPRVLRSTADRTLMNRMLRSTQDRTTRQESMLRFDHRQVEKRLLAQSVPAELIQRVLQTLNETSTFSQIGRRLAQRGLSTHQIQQVMQTLVHPRVYQRSNADRNLLQTTLLRFDHHHVETEPSADDLPSLGHRAPSLLVPDSTRTQPDRALDEATQIHRFANTAAAHDEPFTTESLIQRRDGSYGGGAPIELYRPKPADPPPPPPAPAPPPAPPVQTEQTLKLENIAPDDLQRLTDRIYREIEKRAKLERSLRGL